MKHNITAPVEEFTGVVAGVHFRDGSAETSDENAVAYFRRQGYTVESAKAPARKAPAKAPDDKKDEDPDGTTDPGKTPDDKKEG